MCKTSGNGHQELRIQAGELNSYPNAFIFLVGSLFNLFPDLLNRNDNI